MTDVYEVVQARAALGRALLALDTAAHRVRVRAGWSVAFPSPSVALSLPSARASLRVALIQLLEALDRCEQAQDRVRELEETPHAG